MSTAADLRDFAKPVLASIANRSGRVLCSSAATLRPGTIYLLGLNPGDDPQTHAAETVGESLENLPSRTRNAYLDESWGGQPKGENKFQRRVDWLLTNLGSETRDVCASNLIFTCSTAAGDSGYPQTATLCWPVHERIISIVQPRLILVFGNSSVSPFQFLRQQYQPLLVDFYSSGHGNWRCQGFSTLTDIKVIGLPHLSRYAVHRHEDVVEWIKAYGAL